MPAWIQATTIVLSLLIDLSSAECLAILNSEFVRCLVQGSRGRRGTRKSKNIRRERAREREDEQPGNVSPRCFLRKTLSPTRESDECPLNFFHSLVSSHWNESSSNDKTQERISFIFANDEAREVLGQI